MNSCRVVIADIVRPRGNRGELIAISQTDVPGRLQNLKSASVRLSDGSDVQVEIEHAWPYRDHWVLKFAGIDSITEADKFRGADLWLPYEQRGQLPDGEVFRSDLLGCSIYHAASGEPLGRVEGFQQYGGPLMLETSIGDREILIPFVDSICRKVDLDAKSIWVDPPEGLLDL